MGVARRTQRQFPMPPRALPPGRMGLLSPSGIGGISPRHALTSPSLGGQGRQVSWLEAEGLVLLGLGVMVPEIMCVHLFVSEPSLEGRELLCQRHHSWVLASSPLTQCFLSPRALCRTCGSPTPEAVTACRARAAALCSAPTRSRSTHRPRPFSCSLQVRTLGLCLNSILSWTFISLLGLVHTVFAYVLFLSPPLPHHLLSPLIPTPLSLSLPSCVGILVFTLVSVTISFKDH